MDPVTAFSLAAAVVQFAAFGHDLVTGARRFSKSRKETITECIDISTEAHDLDCLAKEVEYQKTQGGQFPESSGEILSRLCVECGQLRDDIQAMVRTVQAKGSKKGSSLISSLIAGSQSSVAKEELQNLKHRLKRLRQQAMMAVLCLLVDETNKNNACLQQFVYGQATKKLSGRKSTKQSYKYPRTDPDNSGPKSTSTKQPYISPHMKPEKMEGFAVDIDWDAKEYLHLLRNQSHDVFPAEITAEHLREILYCLKYDSMCYRETEIPERHAATFEWMFQTPPGSPPQWSDFPQWLEDASDKIYWITGKPGSGKSTLMKFISSDSRLESSLQRWAGNEQLIMARYFSWIAGTDMLQRSHKGLLRSLISQILQNKPDLIPQLSPSRWLLLEAHGSNTVLPPFEEHELRTVFWKILSLARQSFKLFIIIDGLDEFDENHRELVELLHLANKNPDVKICASSRPWNVFRDEYSRNPMLQLERLTHGDIKAFVHELFRSSLGYCELAITDPDMARQIREDITQKADGVFLWVSVVTGMLLSLFQEGVRGAVIKQTVEDLPGEMNELFRFMWERTTERFRRDASHYYKLMKAFGKYRLDARAITIWLGDNGVSIHLDFKAINTEGFFASAMASLRRILISRTGGLLEMHRRSNLHTNSDSPTYTFDNLSADIYGDLSPDIHGDSSPDIHGDSCSDPHDNSSLDEVQVDYMHRTARDWVQDNWEMIKASAEQAFDPTLHILKGEILRVCGYHNCTDREAVGNLLAMAANVRDKEDTRKLLVDTLEKLDWYVTEALGTKSKFQYRGNEHQGHSDDDHHSHGSNNEPHWCNTPKYHFVWGPLAKFSKRSMKHVDFIGLTAQICIVPYLKWKAEHQPEQFRKTSSEYGILENLVFGAFVNMPQFRIPVRQYSDIISLDMAIDIVALTKRLDILRLILSKRLCINEVKKLQTMVQETIVEDLRIIDTGTKVWTEEELLEYKNSILSLLENCAQKRNEHEQQRRSFRKTLEYILKTRRSVK